VPPEEKEWSEEKFQHGFPFKRQRMIFFPSFPLLHIFLLSEPEAIAQGTPCPIGTISGLRFGWRFISPARPLRDASKTCKKIAYSFK
jgi:hypothetical protein